MGKRIDELLKKYSNRNAEGLSEPASNAGSAPAKTSAMDALLSKYNRRNYAAEQIQKNGMAFVDNLNKLVGTWGTEYNTAITDYTSRFQDRTDGYKDSYLSDTTEALEGFNARKKVLDDTARQIENILSVYGDYLDADTVSQLRQNLKNGRMALREIGKGYSGSADFFGNFADENEYAQWQDTTFRTGEEYFQDRLDWYDETETTLKSLEEIEKGYTELMQKSAKAGGSVYNDGGRYSRGHNSRNPGESTDIKPVGYTDPDNIYSNQAAELLKQHGFGSIEELRAEKEALAAERARYERGEGEWATYDEETGLQTGFRNLESDRQLAKLQDKDFVDSAKKTAELSHIPSFEELAEMDKLIYDQNFTMDLGPDGQTVAYSSVDGSVLIQDKDGNFHHALEYDPRYTSIDRLGVYLSADSDQKAKTSLHGAISTWDNIKNQGIANHWDFLTPEEVSVYYGLKAQSDSEADAFLQQMQSTLNHRYENARAKGLVEEYEKSGWLHRLRMQGRTVLEQGVSGIASAVTMLGDAIEGEETDVYGAAFSGARYANTIRGHTAKKLDEAAPDLNVLGLSLGDIYQAGMSGVDSLAVSWIPGGSVVLGTSSAANQAMKLYQEGADQAQILGGAMAAGIVEMAAEAIPLDKLNALKTKDVYTWGDFLLNAAKQAGCEFVEEATTEIANGLTDAIIRRSESDWAKLWKENEGNGWKVAGIIFGEVLAAGVSGALSGAGTAGVVSIGNTVRGTMQTRNIGRAIKTAKGGVEGMKTYASTVAQNGNNRGLGRFASKLTDKSSAARVGKAYRMTEAAVREQNKADLSKTLQEKGYSKKQADQIAEAAVSSAAGWRLTEKQQSIWSAAQSDPDVVAAVKDALTGEDSGVRRRNQMSEDFRQGVRNRNMANSQTVGNGQKIEPGRMLRWMTGEIGTPVKGQSMEDPVFKEVRRQMRENGLPVEEAVAEETTPQSAAQTAPLQGSLEQSGDDLTSVELRERMQEAFQKGEITEEEYDDYLDAMIEQQGLDGVVEEEAQLREKAEAVKRAEEQATAQEKSVLQEEIERQWGVTAPQSAAQEQEIATGTSALAMTNDNGGTDNGTGVLHGSSQRNDRASAGEPAGSMAGRAGTAAQRNRSAVDRIRKTNERRALGKNLRLDKVSSASLGVASGTEKANLQVIPEEYWDDGLRAKAEQVMAETGKSVVYVLGNIETKGAAGKLVRVRGVITESSIIIQADNAKLSAEQIADHEAYHGMADVYRESRLNDRLIEWIRNTFTKEEFDKVVDKYIFSLRETIDVEGAQTGEEKARRIRQVQEEVLADAYAGINNFGNGATAFTDTVRGYLKDNHISRENSQDNGTEQPTGPPAGQKENTADFGGERYSSEGSVVDLSANNELSARIGSLRGAEKYKVIQQYILEVLQDQPITLSDGKKAIVDKRDALHIANKSGTEKTSQIARIKKLVEAAVLYAEYPNAEHGKFNHFYYYVAEVRFNGDVFPLYLNVGRAKNDGSYHIYDITKKIRDTADRINGLERPVHNTGNALESDTSNKIIRNQIENVKQKIQTVLDKVSPNHAAQMERYSELKDSDPDLAQKFYDGLMDSPYSMQFEEYLKLTEELEQLESEASAITEPETDKTGTGFVERASVDDSDQEYMDAVARDDIATAQMMVDQAARAAEYDARMFHETDAENIHIFDISLGTHGGTDYQTPYGIFTKSSRKNIGLGSKQMELFVKARKTLRVENREDVLDKIPGFAKYYDQIQAIDKKYDAIANQLEDEEFDALMKWMEEHPDVDMDEVFPTEYIAERKPADIDDARYLEAHERYMKNRTEWEEKYNEVAIKAKAYITEYLRNNNYDSMYFVVDGGSRGRQTDSLIVLNENQVKSAEPITYDDDGNVIPLSKRFNTEEKDVRYSMDDSVEEEEQRDSYSTLPAKARDYVRSAERNLLDFIGQALSVPKAARRDFLAQVVRAITNEYLTTGTVSAQTIDSLFQQAYAQGVVADEEFFNQYKHIKDHMRSTAVTLAEQDRSDIADFTDFKRQAGGLLKIRNEGGLPVDVAYQELQDMAPELFPDNITHPADQLVRMLEVAQSIEVSYMSLDRYYGDDAANFKRDARHEFENAVDKVLNELRMAKRYMDDRNAERDKAPTTVEEAMEAWKELKAARRNYEKTMAKNLLTEHDQRIVGDLLYGKATLENLDPERDNVKGITAVYEAKREYAKLVSLLAEYKRNLKAELRAEADSLLETANEWKDKGSGLAYSRETMRRNVLDIVRDPEVADKILRKYFEPVAIAEAAATRFKDKYRERVEALNLSRKVKKGDAVSEAHAVQLLGEALDNIAVIESARGRLKHRDGKTLTEWKAVVQELWESSPSLDRAKIEKAVQEFREIYDDLFQQMNQVRVQNGYEPVNYRKGYFPHFQKESTDGILAHFGRALGISTEVAALPTTINGLTHTFRPGIQWFGNALQRTGFATAYDAVEGFDKYIEGVASVIHQTENIQRLRALASQIRYRTSDEGIRAQVDKVLQDERFTEEEKQSQINSIYEHGRFSLSGFVVELDEYTNLLANKKSRRDREIESDLGRRFYNVAKWLEQRIAANMIAGNLSSALTNVIPLTQAAARMDRGYLIRGMWNTLKAYKVDDGMVETSTFLTNRRGSDPLIRTWQDKVSNIAGLPMELIDQFVADSIVRGAYYQNLKRGLTEDEALHQADLFAASVMADRSKGAMPTIFSATNPGTKLFTMFQLEVNNQFSEIFKDMPREMRSKGKLALAAKLLQYVLGAFLFNELFEALFGRRPALDPVGILNETIGDLSGYELPNLLELLSGVTTGNVPSFKTEKAGVGQSVLNLGENILGELPFSSALGLLGIGEDSRIPVESALPDVTKLINAATNSEWAPEKRWRTAVDELVKPVTYLALPFGGNQLSKTVKGIIAAVQGGSYTVDNKGNDILQYPVFDDPFSVLRAVIMGKNAVPEGQDWVDDGFDSFSAKATATYQGILDVGVDDREAYALVDELRHAKKTDSKTKADVQRDLLRDSDISAEAKVVAYCGMVATESELEWMNRLLELDPDAQSAFDVAVGLKEADALKGDAVRQARAEAIADTALTEAQKIVAVESFLGNEWQNEDGKPTTYAKFRDMLEAGLTVDDFMKLYASGLDSDGMDKFLKYVDSGLDANEAAEMLKSVSALKPAEGKTTVSNVQKWRAAVDSQSGTEDQLIALSAVMDEKTYQKVELANEYGVKPDAYVGLREILPKYDEDGNSSYNQKEITAAVNAVSKKMNLTTEQKAVLWQIMASTKSAKNNPYSVEIGWKVIDALSDETLSFGEMFMKQVLASM